MGRSSPSSTSHQVTALKATGYVRREARLPRTAPLRPPSQDDADPDPAAPGHARKTEIPPAGRIAPGAPVITDQLAEQAEDVIPVPMMPTGEGNHIALQIAAATMTRAPIADDDRVVVRQQPDTDNEDIIAAMLASDTSADHEATIKAPRKADRHAWPPTPEKQRSDGN